MKNLPYFCNQVKQTIKTNKIMYYITKKKSNTGKAILKANGTTINEVVNFQSDEVITQSGVNSEYVGFKLPNETFVKKYETPTDCTRVTFSKFSKLMLINA